MSASLVTLVQVTDSTRISATTSLFSSNSCSDIGAGKAKAGTAHTTRSGTKTRKYRIIKGLRSNAKWR